MQMRGHKKVRTDVTTHANANCFSTNICANTFLFCFSLCKINIVNLFAMLLQKSDKESRTKRCTRSANLLDEH